MRKTIAWAAIVLMLVVSLQQPVVSRTTPYTPDEIYGPNPDHPWGGDQNSSRQGSKPATAIVTGIPIIDLTHGWFLRWMNHNVIWSKPPIVVTPRPDNPNQPPTNGTTRTSNPAN
ncbi:hypothetical protein C3F09_11605 [candidate division GN15 bacterium]|uniref:Uncharacterized protein n=1 Tax=candidate division GN15 bacterium TaxID=2072418 RepID=A0A855WV56_9BACT|nr:MAG: hypothetical protein C3F09_11605 [candidate division GN15 bacterium]